MIPRTFHKAEPWQLILILLAASLLWIPQFGKASLPLCHHSRSFLCPLLETFSFSIGQGGMAGQILAFLLILAMGMFIVFILNANQLIDRASYFPAYVFVIFASYSPMAISLHPVIPALLLLLVALFFILKAYDESSALKMMFSAGFSISIASLFYFPVMGFGLLPWLALLIFRDFSWHNWVGAFLGLITPYVYILSWIFIVHDAGMIRNIYFESSLVPMWPPQNFPWQVYLFWAITGLIMLRSIFSVLWHLNEKLISYRKKQLVILWFLILILITLFFSEDAAVYHSIILSIPITFYFTIYFQGRRKRWTNDVVFVIMLGALVLAYLS